MRRLATVLAAGSVCAAVAGCGGGSKLAGGQAAPAPGGVQTPAATVHAQTPRAGQRLGFPSLATKNTTRVGGSDPAADAAAVALAVYPSAAPGTHPAAVTIAPTDDWQAALAAAVLMSRPIRAPVLLSGKGSLPPATADALNQLAPTGSGAAGGAQAILIGDVPNPGGLHTVSIAGSDPYTVAAGIDRFASAALGRASTDVVIAPADNAAYAMPAAGWAAESGEPILYVNSGGVPPATQQALLSHGKPHIYVLGPPNVIPDTVLAQLRRFGPVKRVGADDVAANSVAFAEYRDPACPFQHECAHIPGSFGWAMRSPGHGYVLINANRTLDAAAAAPLSASGDYGVQLLIRDPTTLPSSVATYLENYAAPGYCQTGNPACSQSSQEGPTAAVYDHGWVIGDESAVSVGVQAEFDSVLEVAPVNGGSATGQ